MTVMALRSGKNAGLHVPDDTFKKAIAYIKSCYRPTQGGFTYQPGSGQPGFARTAAGCCVLFLSGEYTAKEIPDAVDYLKKHFDSPMHFYYGQYYAVHAMYQVGGKDWEDWYAPSHRLVPAEAERRRQLEPDIAPRGRAGVSDGDRGHRAVDAGALSADLPAVSVAASFQLVDLRGCDTFQSDVNAEPNRNGPANRSQRKRARHHDCPGPQVPITAEKSQNAQRDGDARQITSQLDPCDLSCRSFRASTGVQGWDRRGRGR